VKRGVISLGILALVGLAGCEGLNSEQQRMLSGGAIGAAGGAVVGAFIGSPAIGAAVGGAAGAAVGAYNEPAKKP
jgi:osmotically inducible lipoprotein OsmB